MLSFENTRKAVFLAIAFVTLPFIVRTVQPVLEEMESDVEDAAASLGASRFTTFRRIVLPTLVPAIFAGAALSFARGISEYGSLVLLSGNLPNRTEVDVVPDGVDPGGRQPTGRGGVGDGHAGRRPDRDRHPRRHADEGWPAVASASAAVGETLERG